MHILFYSDVQDFGGHEAMTLHAVRHLSQHSGWALSFAVFEGNQRYIDALMEIGGVRIIPMTDPSRSLQGFRSRLQTTAISRISKLIREANPDLVVLSQGGIEQCTIGLLAALRAGYRTASYIPYAHTYTKMRSALGPLRDIVDAAYYKLPNSFITIGNSMSEQLRERGATQPIAVVPNGIEPPDLSGVERTAVRREMGVADDECLIGIVGRIVFSQKRHDVLVEAFAQFQKLIPKSRLLVVGEGPDRQAAQNLCKKHGVEQSTIFLPWTKNVAEIYAAIDILAIPSRFEGVPLVMLEAMACSLPIAASNIDGMKDTLPDSWLFDAGDPESLAKVLLRLQTEDQSAQIAINKQRALTEFSLEQFGRNFQAAVEECVVVKPNHP